MAATCVAGAVALSLYAARATPPAAELPPEAKPTPPPAEAAAPPPPAPAVTAPAAAEKVVRLSNPRRVRGDGPEDDLLVDFEVLRDGLVIANDAAMVKTKSYTSRFEVSAPGRTGTLRLAKAIVVGQAGAIEVWLILRRGDKEYLSNEVLLN
jgi:hypothetical protein